jgi:hypothetical protein
MTRTNFVGNGQQLEPGGHTATGFGRKFGSRISVTLGTTRLPLIFVVASFGPPRLAAGAGLADETCRRRIAQLTIDDIIRGGDHILLRLGDPPSPAPEPVAVLLFKYIGQRSNMRTAPTATRAGQPLQPRTLSPLIHELGVPTTAERTAAIRRHVLDLPRTDRRHRARPPPCQGRPKTDPFSTVEN